MDDAVVGDRVYADLFQLVLAALPEDRRRNLRRLSRRVLVGQIASARVRASMGCTVPTLLDVFAVISSGRRVGSASASANAAVDLGTPVL
ncbi:MAG: hypothetical protein VYE73_07320 [Acidobacteriota bacterium]|nr:hypothetical protein [Acidobacteriota bacterium]